MVLAEMRRVKIKSSVVTYNFLFKGVVCGIGKVDCMDEVF